MPAENTKISSPGATQDDAPPLSLKRQILLGLLLLTAVLVVGNLIGEAGLLILQNSSLQEESRKVSVHDDNVDGNSNGDLDKEIFSRRVKEATEGLNEMETRGAMTTLFSKRETVLKVGFPRGWKTPCVLEAAFQKRRSERLHVAVVGGSTAARPGNNCPDPTVQTDGRFSSLLELKLNSRQDLKFSVQNIAQGGTTSVQGVLLLDGLIDPRETDIIVWDYLVNDVASSGGTAECARKLDFFLSRVKALYAQVHRPPPSIVFVFLWQNGARSVVPKRRNLDYHPLRFAGRILDAYIELGWDIAVLNVGATINATALRDNTGLLLDDTNHPSCSGTNLIADMLQHLFYKNIEECSMDILEQQPVDNTQLILPVPPHKATWAATVHPYKKLWNDLFNDNAKVGSISAWLPQTANRTTALQLTNLHAVDTWKMYNRDKADPNRDDRKMAFLIPKCKDQSPLLFSLAEPDLAWIGLNVQPKVRMGINGQQVNLSPLDGWNFGVTRLTNWVPIEKKSKNDSLYEVTFCDPTAAATVKRFLSFLIGVSVPEKSQAAGQGVGRGNATFMDG